MYKHIEIPKIVEEDFQERIPRLEEVRQEKKVNITRLAKLIGSTQPHISNLLNGKAKLGSDLNDKIVRNLNLSKAWWETGEGRMYNMSNASMYADNFIELPFVSAPARATFAESGEVGVIKGTILIVSEPNVSYQNQVVIEVDGDSMEPGLPKGTKVRCRKIDVGDWPYIGSGVYAVAFRSLFVIKRIRQNDLQSLQTLTLWSDGGDKDKISINHSDIHCIWKAIRIVDGPVF